VWWPLGFSVVGWTLLVLWLVSIVFLAALFLYDLKWTLLPNALMFPLIGIGIIWAGVYYFAIAPTSPLTVVVDTLLSLASVAGLYGLLYAISRGEWVGFGDVKLGIFMGLILGWQQGLLAVMIANVLAFVVIMPGLLTHKVTRKSRIPFGPFLIVATVLALLFGDQILAGYFSVVIGSNL
jgi:prepilin signal peptidase PulO-like enzyme (type II secretory pathway)